MFQCIDFLCFEDVCFCVTGGYMWHEIERETVWYLSHNVIFLDTSQWRTKNRSREMLSLLTLPVYL